MKLPATDMYPRITKLIYLTSGRKYGIAALEINYIQLNLLYVTTHRKHAYRAVIQYCQIDCVLVILA